MKYDLTCFSESPRCYLIDIIIYICNHLQILFSDIVNPPNEEETFMFPSRKSCFCDKYFKETTFNFMNVKMTMKIIIK